MEEGGLIREEGKKGEARDRDFVKKEKVSKDNGFRGQSDYRHAVAVFVEHPRGCWWAVVA